MAHKTTVLVFVFLSMIFGMDAKSVLQKIQTVHGIRINISLEDGTNFTLLDYGKELKCTSNRVFTCYAECSKNFDDNDKEEHEITVTSDKQMGRMHFTFGPNSSNCTIYQCSYLWVVHMLTQKEMNLQLPIDLLYIQRIKQMCREETLNLTVVDLYIRVEKKALNALINMTSDYSTTYNSEDLSMNVLKINLSSPDSYMRIPVPPVVNPEEITETWIPMERFQDNHSKIGVVSYNSDQQFKVKLKDKTVYSKIIRLEVPDREVNKLSNLLKIAFSVNNTSYLSKNYTLSCEFYDEKGDNTWKNDGCSTRKINESLVECNCDHMTPFALLLIQLDISPIQWEVLSYISYVGCSLSAFFSAVTVFAFIFNSTAREASNYIHVSLSGSLFILNVSFMFAEWAATLTMKDVCVLVAVIIHYSLLSSFTWMAIEAFHLYLLLIRVFNIYIKHYTVKLSIVGWGIPAVVIGALLSVYKIKPFYGFTEWTLTDTNTTNAVCWIKEPIVFYGVNLVYFTVIFLLNLGILITVTTQIFQLKRTRSKNGKLPVWKDAVTVLGLMCILGTTWGLAFFSSGKTVYPILYLFCIFNSMQGFYIFVWMCCSTIKSNAQTSVSLSKSTQETSR